MNQLIAVLGSVGSWLGSAAATLLAFILPPTVYKLRERFYPTLKDPYSIEAMVRQPTEAIRTVNDEVSIHAEEVNNRWSTK